MPGGYHDASVSNDYDTKTPETTVTAHGLTVAYVASYSRRVSYKVPLSLKNVTVKDLKNNTSIGLEEAAFYNCSMIENIEIIGHLTKIGKNAFYNTGITSFDIASTVTEMGEGAFSGTKSLVDVTIRSSIISKGMFKNSSTLKHVEILGENVVIQDQAFMNCTALQEMNFNQSVSSVGNEILAGCTALQDLYINMLGANTTGNTVTGSTNFGFLFGKTGGTGLVENTIQIDANTTEIRYIPADVTLHFIGSVIPSYAFAGVSSLKKVVLHEGVREIGDYAFLDTTNLEEVRIPSSLEDCGIYVFKNSGLVTAYFGEGIETIYEGMFANCSNLTNLIFESTTTTYEYRYVDHNVFEEYKKVGANGSFLSTGKYVSGGKDLTIGTEDDIENVIRSEEFYIDNQDGTFYAYGKDTLLGTDDDILVGIGNDHSFGTADDFVIEVIQGKFYKNFLNNTYCTVTMQQDVDGNWNYAFGSTRYALVNGELVEAVVDQKENVYISIPSADYILFQSVGRDGLLGTEDDLIAFLGVKGTSYTVITDAILYENVLVHDNKLYVDYQDNTYQEIMTDTTSYTLGELFCAGADCVIGTEDDISKYATITYDQIQTNPELKDYGKLILLDQEFTYERLITGEDGTHYIYLPWAAFLNEPSYLGFGRDGKLGTNDDVLGMTTSFNPKYTPVEEEPVQIPLVNTNSYIRYENKLYENNVMANTVKHIESEAFINCTGLENLTLSSQLETIDDKAFFRSGLVEITVPSSVDAIGKYVFAENNNLELATVKCVVLGEYMFSEDKKLRKVSIAYSTQVISKGAFNKCTALKLVTFHSNFIQDIHYELPNGYFPDGDQPADGTGSGSEDPLPDADEYVTYLVAQAKKSAITIQSGLDGIEGTADDYYSYGSYYKLIGADLVAQTKDDIVVLIYEGSYYEVVGYDKLSKTINLYRKVTWNSASNSFVYGSYFLGDINGEFSLANQNNRIVVQEDALGNYTYQVGNIHYSYGADGKLGTLDDIKTVTINGVTYTIEEIEGAYYTSLAKNVYYEVDVHNLSLKLVYLTETGFVDTITSVQNSYYFVHENHTLSRIVNGEIEETIYIPYNNTLIEVEERTENVFYENLSGNFYNRWEYNNTQFTSRLICILEDEEKEATYLRGNNTYAVYVDNHVYRVPGDDLILGTEDDSYIVHDRPSENVGGLVFILRTEDGNYYHYHNFNIYFKLDLSKNEYSYVCAGPDGDPTTTHDNNTNIVIGNDGAFYIDNQNGTYYAISGNTLTGTDQDRLVCSANGTQIGNPSDYTLTKYGTDYYRDYLDNTYQQVILTKNGNQWTSSLVGDRFVGTNSGTVDPTLTPQIVVTNDNGFVYIDHHNGTFTQLGADGKFNTSDDTLHLLMDNQKADVNDPMVVAGTYTPEGSGPKTFYYEDLGHNVFRKYEITGSYGSYVYTDLGFIAARNDGKPGNVNDVEAFYNEALQAYYYIDSNSARRGYGLDGLLYGSNRNQDSTYIMYNGKDVDVTSYTLDGTAGLYHINGDNTYTKYRLLDSLVDGNTHEVESIICLGTNQTLDISDSTDVVEVIVNGVATRFLYKNGEETYIAAGADGLLGYGDDDVLCHLGANNRIDYTNAGSDDILDVVAGVTTASYYKLVAGNIYQRIENGVLASFVAAGKTNGVYHIGSVDDLVAKEADVLRVTTEYVEFMYNNFLLATENGIISLYESQMVHTSTIADASSYVIVQRGRDNTYHTADDYMVIEGVATFAQEDGLLGSSDDLMNVVAGLDEMPYAYDAVKQIYYTFVLSGNRFEEKLDAEGHREAVYAPTHVGSATDKALLALSIAGKTQYYLANDAKTYYTYSDGSILQYLVHVGLDDTGSPATLGSIYNYAVVGQTALFAGADGLIGTADDITAFVGGTDERAYGYVDTVDHNIYVKFDLSTGNRIHKDDGSLLIISAGSDRLIGTADDIDTVVLINGHYYYSIGDAYFTSPTHMLGYSDMQMYAGADGEIGTIDDYYNVTRYLVNGAGYRATFVGPDGYYGGNDDLIAVLGTDSYAYYALTDSVFEKYNNIYQRYAMTSTGYTDKIGDLICGGVNCRPGDADDITQASGNLVLAVNGDWYIVIEENKEYLNKSFDGLLGTEDDKHVFVGEDAILGTYDDYYWISIDNYDRKVFPGQTPFEEGDSDEVKEWKKFHGDDIFFTADDYYSVPSEAIVEVDNKVPFELVTIDDYAFFECSSLEEFQLYSPDDFNTYQNLETLGSYAFAGCTSLVSIILPYTLQGDKLIHGTGYGVYIFEDCTSLSTVTFNETYLNHATFIPKGMFKGCVSLHELYFYDSLTKLDVNVFSPSITEVREEAFMNTWVSTDSSDPEIGVIELPAACLKIGEHAFYNSDITTAYLRAESQIEFGIEVFQNSKIEHVEFTFISEFSERIFDNCIYLSTVIIYENGVKGADNTLSSDVRRIEKQAFRNTPALEVLVLNDELDFVGDEAFKGTGLKTVRIPSSLTKEDTVEHLGVNVFEEATSLASVTFAYGTVIIRDGMFKNCTSLSELQFYDYAANETGVVATANEGVYEIHFKKELVTSGTIVPLTKNVFATTVTTVQQYAFYNCPLNGMKDGAYTDTIHTVVFTNSLASLGDYAFAHTDIESITIPSSLTQANIGSYVFAYCDKLKDIVFENEGLGDQMFIDCTGLTSLILPSGITSIGAYAFQNCTSLETVVIPKDVLNIAEGAFANCIKISELTLPFIGRERGSTGAEGLFGWIFGSEAVEGITPTRQYYSKTEYKDNYIPSTIRRITITDETLVSYGAFYNCILEYIKLPDVLDEDANLANVSQLTRIGDYAFYNCLNLDTALIPSQITEIGDYAFAYCKNVVNLAIPQGVEALGNYSFYHCESLPTITVPSSVNKDLIGSHVFAYCTSIHTLYLENNALGVKMFSNCISLLSVVIPEGVTTIESATFENCTNLRYVAIPETVTLIQEAAFKQCASLEILILPFIGSERGNSGRAQDLFGWIFGLISEENSSFPGAIQVDQYNYYDRNNKNNIQYRKVYVPSTLREVYITDETVIGYGAFSNMHMLSKVVIAQDLSFYSDPNHIFEITYGEDDSITGCVLPSQNSDVYNGLYIYKDNTYVMPDQTTPLNEVESLETMLDFYSLYVDENIEHMYSYAFSNANGLLNGFLGMTNISNAEYAFNDCTGMKYCYMPNATGSQANNMFAYCTSLKRVLLPDTITTLGEAAYRWCLNIEYFQTPYLGRDGGSIVTGKRYQETIGYHFSTDERYTGSDTRYYNQYISRYCKYNQIYDNTGWQSARYVPLSFKLVVTQDTLIQYSSLAQMVASLTEVYLSDKVTYIGESAFTRSADIKKIGVWDSANHCIIEVKEGEARFGDKLNSIERLGLAGLHLIKDIVIPNSVNYIGFDAFMNTGLEKLVIPFVGVSRTPETYTYGNNGLNATLGWYFNCDHNWYYTRADLWGGTYEHSQSIMKKFH